MTVRLDYHDKRRYERPPRIWTTIAYVLIGWLAIGMILLLITTSP